ncbi:hypothetical protein I553_9262 [Mycobacterium xenopi 4042]|uniref:Uncharacterized protein n=1 Tax=Mycobacterium xenopi 4042 TaxID=1299334 RepID=X8E5P1_MYCXE|nr:hypothetical protein I553_9262 [Mycobacterium xenopi 4042]
MELVLAGGRAAGVDVQIPDGSGCPWRDVLAAVRRRPRRSGSVRCGRLGAR